MKKRLLALLMVLGVAGLVMAGVAGCSSDAVAIEQSTAQEFAEATNLAPDAIADNAETEDAATTQSDDSSDEAAASVLTSVEGSVLDVAELFTERDLDQSADLDVATYITVQNGTNVSVTEEGVYVLSGSATNVTVQVDAGDEAKVQLVLDGVSITNESAPVISVASADKVFVTLTDSSNHLEVTGAYESASLDAVIFSKSDLVLNGTGSLEVVSAQGNGISAKDDLKITGGTYSVQAATDAVEANDSIRIYTANMTVVAGKDAFHAENAEDSSLGYIYIAGGTFDISAGDDGIQGNAIVQIDGGVINIPKCMEGIEGTYVQINGGDITIYASDDGINAARKSTYDVILEVNGGTIDVTMGSGDTDGFDSNGDIYINGGTISVTANSAFDWIGVGQLNGGEVTVNGTVVTQLTQSQMGGMGGHGGGPGGR